MYIYAEVDPGLSETGLMFKGRVWDAVSEDIGFVFLKYKNHTYCKILCMCLPFNPLTHMIHLQAKKRCTLITKSIKLALHICLYINKYNMKTKRPTETYNYVITHH